MRAPKKALSFKERKLQWTVMEWGSSADVHFAQGGQCFSCNETRGLSGQNLPVHVTQCLEDNTALALIYYWQLPAHDFMPRQSPPDYPCQQCICKTGSPIAAGNCLDCLVFRQGLYC